MIFSEAALVEERKLKTRFNGELTVHFNGGQREMRQSKAAGGVLVCDEEAGGRGWFATRKQGVGLVCDELAAVASLGQRRPTVVWRLRGRSVVFGGSSEGRSGARRRE